MSLEPSPPRLFHFSDDPSIEVFAPRPVNVPTKRGPGREWLNGPLVWAVDELHQAAYLFPGDCPRVLLWLTEATTTADRLTWWGERTCDMIAHVEWSWFDRLRTASINRYELPRAGFEPVPGDDWMWVSRSPVTPSRRESFNDLLSALASMNVELRIMDSLAPLRDVWSTSLHASGVRLRNAHDWPNQSRARGTRVSPC